MEFRILGPLEVSAERGLLKLGGAKQRALLAALLLHANEPVSVDALVDELWGAAPPETARGALQVYVSGLRKLLGSDVVVTTANAYALKIPPEALDRARFERLVEQGRTALADGRPTDAEERLGEALELWRGPALADVVFEAADRVEVERLDELRLSALEDRFEAMLALGRHGEIASELEVLARRQPLRERIVSLLMLALYRSGRQGDALAAYRRLRRSLVDELAIEPTPAVQRLEQAILRQDHALDLATAAPAVVTAAPARKPVTVVAAELEYGVLDPEAERAVATRLLRELAAIATALGAAVEIDDRSLTAVFGVPAVREDDAVRALRCAAALQELAANRSLGLRVGVASGEAVVDAEGVMGPPVPEAARLQHAAEAGMIFVADGARALAGDGAVFADAGDNRWRLVSVRSDAQPIARRLDAPLVGRVVEIARLESIVALAEETGHCQLVTVTGAPGIGKSRLTLELRKRLVGRADVVIGRCRAPGEAHALAPLAQIVREAVGDDAAIDEVLRGARDGPLVSERLAAALAEGGAREHALWATRKLFERLAQRRALVVVFDDMQWADGMLRDLVDYLVDWSRSAALVLVCLGRPELLEERAGWGESSERIHPLPLEPLSAEESSALVAGLAPLDDAVRARIASAAEGNPLFIEQIVAMLGESASVDDVRVPPTIHALLAARLDLLPSAERDLLEHAAVLGREFQLDSLVGLGAAGTQAVPIVLESLVRKQLLAPDGAGYRFAHHLIRDAVYEAIPKLVRADVHELVAERFGDDDALVGHHLECAYRCRADVDPEGADPELAHRAAARLFAAGRANYSRGEILTALALFERGASLPSDDPAARAELLIAVAGALRETTEFDRAAAALEEACALASDAGRRDLVGEARVLRLRLGISIDSDLAAAELRTNAEAAIRELDELGDERGLAEAWVVFAWSSWLRCRAGEAEPALRRAIEHAQRARDQRSLGVSRNLLLGVWLFGPTPVALAEQRCLDVLAESGSPIRIEAGANRALGALAAMRGDFAASRVYFEHDRELIEEAGLRLAATAAAEVWAQSELLAGNIDAAERRLRDALAHLPSGEKSAFSTLAAVLADVLCRAGRYEEALELSTRSEEASTPDDLTSEVQWRAARAQAAAALGDEGAARMLAAEAVSLAETTDFLNLQGGALVASAKVTGSSHDLERAAELFERKGNVVAAAHAREALSVLV